MAKKLARYRPRLGTELEGVGGTNGRKPREKLKTGYGKTRLLSLELWMAAQAQPSVPPRLSLT